jgi:hypothetical protein
MNKRFSLLVVAFFFLFSGAFAAQFEIFPATPIVVADVYEQTPLAMGVGLGLGFTSMDKGESFGVMMNSIVYFHLPDTHIADSAPFPEDMYPVGLDFTFGATVLPIKTNRITFPVTLAFHTRAILREGITQFDFGAAGTAGVIIWGKQSGFFVRSLFYLDFTRVQLVYENFSFEKNLGFEPVARLSTFGIIPEIGFTIRLGKTPEVKP